MKTLSIREMRRNLGRLDDLVSCAGEVIVTRRGQPVVRILPVTGARAKPNHADLRRQMSYLVTPSEALVEVERDKR